MNREEVTLSKDEHERLREAEDALRDIRAIRKTTDLPAELRDKSEADMFAALIRERKDMDRLRQDAEVYKKETAELTTAKERLDGYDHVLRDMGVDQNPEALKTALRDGEKAIEERDQLKEERSSSTERTHSDESKGWKWWQWLLLAAAILLMLLFLVGVCGGAGWWAYREFTSQPTTTTIERNADAVKIIEDLDREQSEGEQAAEAESPVIVPIVPAE